LMSGTRVCRNFSSWRLLRNMLPGCRAVQVDALANKRCETWPRFSSLYRSGGFKLWKQNGCEPRCYGGATILLSTKHAVHSSPTRGRPPQRGDALLARRRPGGAGTAAVLSPAVILGRRDFHGVALAEHLQAARALVHHVLVDVREHVALDAAVAGGEGGTSRL
jgi:hypothetical protein